MLKFKFSKRERFIFIVCLVVCVIGVFYFAVLKPIQNRTGTNDARIEKAQKELAKALTTIRKAKMIEKNYKDVLENFRQEKSDEEVMSGMLSEIENLASEIDIRISDMKPRKVRNVGSYNQFAINLTMDGDLKDIMRFIYQLQNAPHSFYIDELTITQASARSSSLRCQMVLSRILIP